MTVVATLSMLGAMLVLALVPDASAGAVVARSISSGIAHGMAVVVGIIVGDLLFIGLVFSGLAAAADGMAAVFVALQLLGAAFLLWLGARLIVARPGPREIERVADPSWSAGFLVGLLITVGDPKAIGFYLGFLPAFVALETATLRDAFLVFACATVSVGTVKGGYAIAADRARALLSSSRGARTIHMLAGSVMIATAIVVIARLGLAS